MLLKSNQSTDLNERESRTKNYHKNKHKENLHKDQKDPPME